MAETKTGVTVEEFNEEDALFRSRKSIELTKENAIFKRSSGGLISMTLIHENGEREEFERVVPIRAFPISDPDDYISIREPDSKEGGRGLEIGMITHLPDLDPETVLLIDEELDKVEELAAGPEVEEAILAIAREIALLIEAKEIIGEELCLRLNELDRQVSKASRIIAAGIQ